MQLTSTRNLSDAPGVAAAALLLAGLLSQSALCPRLAWWSEDADGIARPLPPLHQARVRVLPDRALTALLAAEPGVLPEVAAGELRLGTRAPRPAN